LVAIFAADRLTIWLYGQDNHFYSPSKKPAVTGSFFEFDMPSEVGHNDIHYPDLWGGPIGDYLNSLSAKR
jgi:hypothetical protein